MKKIIVMISIGLISNIYSATADQGKWYKFTNDYINNCIESVTENKESSDESSGKTVSAVNAPVNLADCLSTSPYMDSEPQIDQPTLGKGCATKNTGDYLVSTGSNGQKIEILSKNKKEKTIFKCSNGNWSQISSSTVNYEKPTCAASSISWDHSTVTISGVVDLPSLRRVEKCYNNLPLLESGKSLKIKSYADLNNGKIKMSCINGVWTKDIGFDATCEAISCTTIVGSGKTRVSWSDSQIIESEESKRLSIYSQGQVKEASIGTSSYNREHYSTENNGEYTEESSGSSGSLDDTFLGNPNLESRPLCVAELKSINSGKTGTAIYSLEDSRLFKTEEDALKESNIIEGSAAFNCVKGRWKVDSATAKCNRKTNYNCAREKTVLVNGEQEYKYLCGTQTP
jgi:hypothetical protein